MKKYLCILIVFVLMLASCNVSEGTSESSDITTQKSEITGNTNPTVEITYSKELEPIGFNDEGKYSIVYYTSEKFNSSEGVGIYPNDKNNHTYATKIEVDKKTVDLQVGKKTFKNALYSYAETTVIGVTYDCYTASDENIEIRIKKDLDEYTILSADFVGSVMKFSGDTITEESLSDFATSYISSVVGEIDQNDYTYYMDTYISWTDEQGEYQTAMKEGFYIPQGTERIISYVVGFVKYINGIRTGDGVCVKLGKNGDLRSFSFANYNVDWAECEIDPEKAENRAREFIENNISDEYEIISYEITGMEITHIFDKLVLVFSAEIEYLIKESSAISNTNISIGLG